MKDDKEKKTLTPRLRFPEFRDELGWEQVALGSVLHEHAEKDDGTSDVHSVSVHKGVVNQVKHLGRSFAALDRSNYNLAKPHDIIYTKSPTGEFPYGVVKQNRHPYNVIVSPLYGVFTPANKYLGYILDAYFESSVRTNNYLAPIAQKGAKNTIQISNATFLSKGLYLPGTKAEQEKIAECLSSVDVLIEAQAGKVETLKAHKKGLLQQLFPSKGENLPHRRFPEFYEAPEWCTDTIGKLFETTSGGTPDRAVKAYWGGAIPWVTTSLVDFNVIRGTEEFITDAGLNNSSAKLFPKNTVLIAMYGQGKTRGKVALLGIEATTNQACAALLPGNEIVPAFVFFSLCGRYDELRRLSNSGGQENLSQGLIRELSFSYPKDPAEQRKIVNCLVPLDRQIAAESEELDVLKAHKKGLMRQLFPLAGERL